MTAVLSARESLAHREKFSGHRPPLQLLGVELAEMFRGFDVAPGPARQIFLFVESKLAADFSGRAKDEGAGRNFHAEGNERVRADDGAGANFRAIENDRPHADKNFIVDLAGVHDGAVPNRDELTYDRRKPGVEMDNGVVLHIGAGTDDDAVDVASQNGPIPDARFLFESHVADDSGAGNNPGGRMNSGTFF